MLNNEIGFLSIAQNSTHDYLSMAYLQAMMLKRHMPSIPYAVIVDGNTKKNITDKMSMVFDNVILLENDKAINDEWKLKNEPSVYDLTPFKQTIKLEADVLINRNIEHWFNILYSKDIVFSLGAKTFLDEVATSRFYRRVFDENELPDIYSGMMYFKRSSVAGNFFRIASTVFENWNLITPQLKYVSGSEPTTDVVYALVTKILGVENCTIPSLNFFSFVHMKNRINEWLMQDWQDSTIFELGDQIRVANTNQYSPFHYQAKNLITSEMISEYERQSY